MCKKGYRGCTGSAQGCTGREKVHTGDDRGRQEIFLRIVVFRASSVRGKVRILHVSINILRCSNSKLL